LPTGTIHGKMILCCSVWDREAFAWQGDWYRNKVKEHLGNATDDNFRLWYTDRATHGDSFADNPVEVVPYVTTLYQALLDLSDWVERGIEPSKTSDYLVEDGQVMLSDDGNQRGGVQPVVTALVEGKELAEVAVGQKVNVHVTVDVPKGTGRLVKADWCLNDSKEFTLPVDLSKTTFSTNGEHAEFDTVISYDKPGTYFATVRVSSERNGDVNATQTYISNLGKVRIIVK